MTSRFYQNNSRAVLICIVVTMPVLFWEGESVTCNNDIEAWLQQDSGIRATYEDFKQEFGGEEFVMIGLEGRAMDDPLVEALAERLEHSPHIRTCHTPARLASLMRQQGVPEEQIAERIRGLTVSRDGEMIGVVALLSDEGLADRAAAVQSVHEQLDYCQFRDDEVLLAGVPVVVTELDRLGSMRENERFFIITLVISLALLYWFVREWKLTLAIIVLTIWGIQLNQAILKWTGGEMNFILSAMPALVMIFTLSIAIHVVHYYRLALSADPRTPDGQDPLRQALHAAWRPCFLATLTTVIGLVSLCNSNIRPVADFGLLAAIGSVVAMLVGLGLVPAAIMFWPPAAQTHETAGSTWPLRAGFWIVKHGRSLTVVNVAVIALMVAGAMSIRSHIDPLDFLPTGSRVRNDTLRIDRELTNVESVEAIIDFGVEHSSFIEKLDRIHTIEQRLASHPDVRHTLSVASFFPREFPDSTLETARMLSEASAQKGSAEYLSRGQRFWRITLRLRQLGEEEKGRVLGELQARVPDVSMTLTGITPLLSQAQVTIFQGFWESFGSALVIIGLITIVALRSIRLGLLAMIPNIAPIALVFGILGWTGTPVDIGTMMTASIALGISVDGTLHYMEDYQRRLRQNPDRHRAAVSSLLHTGAPIFSAAVVESISMLALMLSSFRPTANFGMFMALQLVAYAFGNLCVLPALLSCGRRRPRQRELQSVRFPASSMPGNYRKTA